MKKIIIILFAAVVSAAVSVTAFADNSPEDCRSFESFFDSDELAIVIEQTADDDFMKEIEYTAANVHRDNNIGEYKEYSALYPDFLDRLANGTPVKELISDEYAWIIPSGEYTADVHLNDKGEWYTVRIGRFDEEVIKRGIVKDDSVRFDQVNSAIEKIGMSNIEDVICINMPTKYVKFVCLVSDTTYVIPFCPRPDFNGFENGKLYTAAEANEIWFENVASKISTHNAEIINGRDIDELTMDELLSLQIGGLGTGNGTATQPEVKNNMPIIPILIIPAAAIAAAITITMLVWNKRGKKHSK